LRFALRDKETSDVVPKRQANSKSQAGRLSLQGMRVRHEEEVKDLSSKKGQGRLSLRPFDGSSEAFLVGSLFGAMYPHNGIERRLTDVHGEVTGKISA
jgi:hypothetical protein